MKSRDTFAEACRELGKAAAFSACGCFVLWLVARIGLALYGAP